MVALDLALELEAILLDAVRTHVEGGEVDVSSVSLRPQELARLVPRGVDASLFVQAGLLVKSGSMYKLAPHVMLALRDPDKAGSREQLAVAAAAAASSESPASEAAGTKRPAAADGGGEGGGTPMRKRAHSNLTLPLVHGLPAGVPLIWSWSVEQAEVDGQLRLCIGGHFHRRQGFEAGEYGVTSAIVRIDGRRVYTRNSCYYLGGSLSPASEQLIRHLSGLAAPDPDYPLDRVPLSFPLPPSRPPATAAPITVQPAPADPARVSYSPASPGAPPPLPPSRAPSYTSHPPVLPFNQPPDRASDAPAASQAAVCPAPHRSPAPLQASSPQPPPTTPEPPAWHHSALVLANATERPSQARSETLFSGAGRPDLAMDRSSIAPANDHPLHVMGSPADRPSTLSGPPQPASAGAPSPQPLGSASRLAAEDMAKLRRPFQPPRSPVGPLVEQPAAQANRAPPRPPPTACLLNRISPEGERMPPIGEPEFTAGEDDAELRMLETRLLNSACGGEDASMGLADLKRLAELGRERQAVTGPSAPKLATNAALADDAETAVAPEPSLEKDYSRRGVPDDVGGLPPAAEASAGGGPDRPPRHVTDASTLLPSGAPVQHCTTFRHQSSTPAVQQPPLSSVATPSDNRPYGTFVGSQARVDATPAADAKVAGRLAAPNPKPARATPLAAGGGGGSAGKKPFAAAPPRQAEPTRHPASKAPSPHNKPGAPRLAPSTSAAWDFFKPTRVPTAGPSLPAASTSSAHPQPSDVPTPRPKPSASPMPAASTTTGHVLPSDSSAARPKQATSLAMPALRHALQLSRADCAELPLPAFGAGPPKGLDRAPVFPPSPALFHHSLVAPSLDVGPAQPPACTPLLASSPPLSLPAVAATSVDASSHTLASLDPSLAAPSLDAAPPNQPDCAPDPAASQVSHTAVDAPSQSAASLTHLLTAGSAQALSTLSTASSTPAPTGMEAPPPPALSAASQPSLEHAPLAAPAPPSTISAATPPSLHPMPLFAPAEAKPHRPHAALRRAIQLGGQDDCGLPFRPIQNAEQPNLGIPHESSLPFRTVEGPAPPSQQPAAPVGPMVLDFLPSPATPTPTPVPSAAEGVDSASVTTPMEGVVVAPTGTPAQDMYMAATCTSAEGADVAPAATPDESMDLAATAPPAEGNAAAPTATTADNMDIDPIATPTEGLESGPVATAAEGMDIAHTAIPAEGENVAYAATLAESMDLVPIATPADRADTAPMASPEEETGIAPMATLAEEGGVAPIATPAEGMDICPPASPQPRPSPPEDRPTSPFSPAEQPDPESALPESTTEAAPEAAACPSTHPESLPPKVPADPELLPSLAVNGAAGGFPAGELAAPEPAAHASTPPEAAPPKAAAESEMLPSLDADGTGGDFPANDAPAAAAAACQVVAVGGFRMAFGGTGDETVTLQADAETSVEIAPYQPLPPPMPRPASPEALVEARTGLATELPTTEHGPHRTSPATIADALDTNGVRSPDAMKQGRAVPEMNGEGASPPEVVAAIRPPAVGAVAEAERGRSSAHASACTPCSMPRGGRRALPLKGARTAQGSPAGPHDL